MFVHGRVKVDILLLSHADLIFRQSAALDVGRAQTAPVPRRLRDPDVFLRSLGRREDRVLARAQECETACLGLSGRAA